MKGIQKHSPKNIAKALSTILFLTVLEHLYREWQEITPY